jgi:AcrR family transcriptional regulator
MHFNFELSSGPGQVETVEVRSAPASPPIEALLVDQRARTFAQDRARRTYEALVEAAAEAFMENGYDATGSPDIAARAGVAVGTFYRYFDDKKQAFLEVCRRNLALGYSRILERLTPERFGGKARHATIAEAIDILLEHVSMHPRMHRVFVEMSMRDPDVAQLRQAFDDASRARLTKLCELIATRQAVPDPEATAWVIYTAAVECASAVAGLHGPMTIDVTRAKEALSRVIERALFDS